MLYKLNFNYRTRHLVLQQLVFNLWEVLALILAISSHFSMTWSIIDAATLNVHAGTNTALWSVHSQCSSFHLQNTELTLWVYAVEGRSFERGN